MVSRGLHTLGMPSYASIRNKVYHSRSQKRDSAQKILVELIKGIKIRPKGYIKVPTRCRNYCAEREKYYHVNQEIRCNGW